MKKIKLISAVVTAFILSVSVSATGDISTSVLVTGTRRLITDITTWLTGLAPVVGVVLIIYFLIRRSAADEMDQKKWNGRILAVVISVIGVVIASALIGVLVSYYT